MTTDHKTYGDLAVDAEARYIKNDTPCPFCGNDCQEYNDWSLEQGYVWFRYRCFECDCQYAPVYKLTELDIDTFHDENVKAFAKYLAENQQ